MANNNENIEMDKIEADYQSALKVLPEHLSKWLREHSITPRMVSIAHNTDGSDIREYILITDHTGQDDSSYRALYDKENKQYGIECTLDTDVHYLIGFCGSLVDTVNEM